MVEFSNFRIFRSVLVGSKVFVDRFYFCCIHRRDFFIIIIVFGHQVDFKRRGPYVLLWPCVVCVFP